jgi:hypothetical protein
MTITIRAVDEATAPMKRVTASTGQLGQAWDKLTGDFTKGKKWVDFVSRGMSTIVATTAQANDITLKWTVTLGAVGSAFGPVGLAGGSALGLIIDKMEQANDAVAEFGAALKGLGELGDKNAAVSRAVLGVRNILNPDDLTAYGLILKDQIEDLSAQIVEHRTQVQRALLGMLVYSGPDDPGTMVSERLAKQVALFEGSIVALNKAIANRTALRDVLFELANPDVPENVQKIARAFQAWDAAIQPLNKELAQLSQDLAFIADTMAGRTTDAFFEIIEGTKSVSQAFADMVSSILKDIGRMFLQRGLTQLFGNLLGGIFGGGGGLLNPSFAGGGSTFFNLGPNASPMLIPTRASGGPVSAGARYMTGEYGPEVITPRQAGYVARSSAASPAVNVTVNVIGNPNPGAVQRETTAGLMAALDRHRALRQKVRRT